MLELPDGVEELESAALAERIAGRLHLVPRFRQVVVPAPLGDPLWVDDPEFRLDRHLTVSKGGFRTRADLDRLAAEFFSEQLDRARPLWQLVVVPRAAPGKAAILGKVHHAMVDGIAAVELGTLLFDLAPHAATVEPEEWDPEPVGAPLRLAVDAVADGAVGQFRVARRLATVGLAPRRTLRVAESMGRAARSIAEDVIRPAPPSFMNAPISPRRALVTESVALSRLMRIKETRGVKLNDVVLAVVAGALRRYAALADVPADPLRAMVPVNVRGATDGSADGNRITFAFIDLPLPESEAGRRLAIIHGRTQELKSSGKVAASDALIRSMVHLPGFLKERAARLAASPRMYNLAVSNVPGPRVPLYAAGAMVSEIYPVIPNSDGHAIAIGVLTYRDVLHFAAYVDPTVLPDSAELAPLFRDAVGELEHAVGRGNRRKSGYGKPARRPAGATAGARG